MSAAGGSAFSNTSTYCLSLLTSRKGYWSHCTGSLTFTCLWSPAVCAAMCWDAVKPAWPCKGEEASGLYLLPSLPWWARIFCNYHANVSSRDRDLISWHILHQLVVHPLSQLPPNGINALKQKICSLRLSTNPVLVFPSNIFSSFLFNLWYSIWANLGAYFLSPLGMFFSAGKEQ